MADIDVVIRRLRGLLNDKPRGRSMSAAGFVTSLSTKVNARLNISMSGGSAKLASITSPSGLLTGPSIAAGLQAAIRAVTSPTPEYSLATVEFDPTRGYIVRNGLTGSTKTVTITDYTVSAPEDVAANLKLGITNAGIEDLDPRARYSDDELTVFLNDALSQWNGLNTGHPDRTWDDIPEGEITPTLYLAWIMSLEADMGSAVYTYDQTLGGDSLDLTSIFRQLLDLLKYLRDTFNRMTESLGVSGLVVSELTRYDRQRDMSVPDYIPTRLPRPRFLQLNKINATSALVEWAEFLSADFSEISVWTSTSPSMVDRSLQTNQPIQGQNDKVGMSAASVQQRKIHDQHFTSATITGLSTANIYFVLVVRDSRGYYHYSDEYSLDLSDSDPDPVLSVSNEPLG